MARSTSIRCPGETYTGLTSSLVRSTAPMTLPSLSSNSARSPRFGPGSKCSPYKRNFGHADRRALQPQSHLGGNSNAARMGDPLAVEHQQVGFAR